MPIHGYFEYIVWFSGYFEFWVMSRSRAAVGKRLEQGTPSFLSCFELMVIQGKSLTGGLGSICLTLSRHASRVLLNSLWFTPVVGKPLNQQTNGICQKARLALLESCPVSLVMLLVSFRPKLVGFQQRSRRSDRCSYYFILQLDTLPCPTKASSH